MHSRTILTLLTQPGSIHLVLQALNAAGQLATAGGALAGLYFAATIGGDHWTAMRGGPWAQNDADSVCSFASAWRRIEHLFRDATNPDGTLDLAQRGHIIVTMLNADLRLEDGSMIRGRDAGPALRRLLAPDLPLVVNA